MAWGYGEPAPKPAFAAKDREKSRAKAKLWELIKRLVRKRDGGRCVACGSRQDVDVHHIRFRSTGGKDSTENCALLCRVCHAAVHAYRLAIKGNADKKLTIIRT